MPEIHRERQMRMPKREHRRALLMASLAAGLPVAEGAAAAVGALSNGDPGPRSHGGDSRPSLDGRIDIDEGARNAAADDFGHLVHQTPHAVVRAASPRDVAAAIRWAVASGRRVAPRGCGHSVYGRSQVPDGLVVDVSGLRTVHAVQPDRMVVDAGATWRDVLEASLPRGVAPPVLPGYLDLSVGGTLAVGGVGDTTSHHGLLIDNVLELGVVTGTGDEVTCSAHANAALFDAVRGGLGQVAIITRATLRLVPAPQRVRRYLLHYPDLSTLIADARRVAADGRFDSLQGSVAGTPSGWAYRLEAAAPFTRDLPPDDGALLAGLADDRAAVQLATLPTFDYLNRLATLERTLRGNGQWWHPHPWLTTFVGDSAIEAVAFGELARLAPQDLGPFGQVLISAFRRDAIKAPLARLPADELCHAFNLMRMPSRADGGEAQRLVDLNRAACERVVAAGGTLYPVSAFPMTPGDWRRHFGSAWMLLSEAKQRFDPDHVLTPGYELF